MGPEAENIFKSFTFPEEADKENFNVMLGKCEEYYPKRNVIREHACFHQRVQLLWFEFLLCFYLRSCIFIIFISIPFSIHSLSYRSTHSHLFRPIPVSHSFASTLVCSWAERRNYV